jgi:hypothetical protein
MGLMISRPSRCFASSIALAAARDCREPTGKSAGHIGAGWGLSFGHEHMLLTVMPILRQHLEGYIAGKRAAGRYDLYSACCRAGGYGGGDF